MDCTINTCEKNVTGKYSDNLKSENLTGKNLEKSEIENMLFWTQDFFSLLCNM